MSNTLRGDTELKTFRLLPQGNLLTTAGVSSKWRNTHEWAAAVQIHSMTNALHDLIQSTLTYIITPESFSLEVSAVKKTLGSPSNLFNILKAIMHRAGTAEPKPLIRYIYIIMIGFE